MKLRLIRSKVRPNKPEFGVFNQKESSQRLIPGKPVPGGPMFALYELSCLLFAFGKRTDALCPFHKLKICQIADGFNIHIW